MFPLRCLSQGRIQNFEGGGVRCEFVRPLATFLNLGCSIDFLIFSADEREFGALSEPLLTPPPPPPRIRRSPLQALPHMALSTATRLTQKTRRSEPMLAQCWASVIDGGPTLGQHWFNGACFAGNYLPWNITSQVRTHLTEETWSNAGSMLDHRLRRWSNIEAALGTLLVFIQTAPGYDAVSRGLWIAVFVLPGKSNVFQHGGGWERSRPQGPKNAQNFLMTMRHMSWACDLIAEMVLIFINLLAYLIIKAKS